MSDAKMSRCEKDERAIDDARVKNAHEQEWDMSALLMPLPFSTLITLLCWLFSILRAMTPPMPWCFILFSPWGARRAVYYLLLMADIFARELFSMLCPRDMRRAAIIRHMMLLLIWLLSPLMMIFSFHLLRCQMHAISDYLLMLMRWCFW